MNLGIIALHLDPWRGGVDAALQTLTHCWRGKHELTVYHSAMNPQAALDGVSYVRIPAIPCFRFNIEALSYARNWRRTRALSPSASRHDILYSNHPVLAPYDALTIHFCALDYLPILKAEWRNLNSMTQRVRHVYKRWEYTIAAHLEHSVFGNPSACRRFALHAVSDSVARALTLRFPHLAPEVIPNPVDLSRFRAASDTSSPWDNIHRQMGWPRDCWRHLFVGGGWERKGLAMAIEALRSSGDTTVLIVVGHGPVSQYQALARKWGVEKRVFFAGSQTDIESWFRAADLFVFPSTYESFAIVCIEAMASGLPLLCTPFKGTEMYIEEGRNGFVVNSAADIGARSETLRRNGDLHHALRLGAVNRAREFAAPAVADRMMAFLESARRLRGKADT